jgi:hypothetical protein
MSRKERQTEGWEVEMKVVASTVMMKGEDKNRVGDSCVERLQQYQIQEHTNCQGWADPPIQPRQAR